MPTSVPLTRITASPPYVRYVPIPDMSPDSEPGPLEVFESDSIANNSSFRSSISDDVSTKTTRRREDLQEDDNAGNPNHRNSGNQETPHFNLPRTQDLTRHARYTVPLDSRSHEVPRANTSSQTYVDCVSYNDWNVRILIGNSSFKLHEHQLNRFSVLKKLIRDANINRSGPSASTELVLSLKDENPTDFQNMIGILYLSVCERMTDDNHSTQVLKSTLRLATKYKYEHMREYAIRCLEKRDLPPMERIKLARECNVPVWSEEALDELCAQDGLVTLAEADVLGLETFFELASRREVFRSKRKPNQRPSGVQSRTHRNIPPDQTPSPTSPRRSFRNNAGKYRAQPYEKSRVPLR
ncbi:hypothetical protein RSOLAG1IB_02505 [Rhizoctonia solani AG-1 IB]|uniref:BTB domain-containing protein n=1 Tax=Thanatephorus cucumeris (strain AG1-IB / isolate 7/3/14) TaxID=1108050 RepID=A0A0B7FIF7_THACB|nr:hypothetical protein RSOLAG1IB_02505 [Rhizoctonia solani AG-1 IB]